MEIKKIKPLIYVAGPYSNGGHSVEKNVEIANQYAHKLRLMGFAVVCPHANSTYSLNHEIDWESWLAEDYSIILRCDGIVFIEDWSQSKGAKIENVWGKELGIPIFEYDETNREVEEKELYLDAFLKNIYNYYFGDHSVWVKCPTQVYGFLRIIFTMFRTHIKKNADYSPRNILGVGELGLATRLYDKSCRIMNLIGFNTDTGEYTKPKEAKNESIDDTILDNAVYSVIWMLFRKKCWGC